MEHVSGHASRPLKNTVGHTMKLQKLLFGLVFIVLGFIVLIAATTSSASLSPELVLDNGTTLQARDIKRHLIPFTSIWLRRHLELVKIEHSGQETILFRISSRDIFPSKDRIYPKLTELNEKNQLVISWWINNNQEDPQSITIPFSFAN